jgi:hypothetical protein
MSSDYLAGVGIGLCGTCCSAIGLTCQKLTVSLSEARRAYHRAGEGGLAHDVLFVCTSAVSFAHTPAFVCSTES